MVKLALENLEKHFPEKLKGKRLGAVLHPASITADLRHTLATLEKHNGSLFKLAALFGPQHGILGHTQDNMIEWEGFTDPRLDIPVYSLYGEHREPAPEMLKDLDALLVDLQDVGARYYTFIWTLYLCIKAAEKCNIPVVVIDRPNPIGCHITEGPVLDLEYKSFVGLHSIQVRHGKTIGELALQFKEECFPSAEIHVLEMQGCEKNMWFNQTGLPWVMPSPNMPTLDTAIVYPGQCLLEATNISEARGTTKPFELFGAPWIEAPEMCDFLNNLKLPGVYFRESHFQPTFHKYAGQICHGAQIHVLEREEFLPFETTIQILKHLFRRYPNDFAWKPPPYEYEFKKLPIDILLGNGSYRELRVESNY
ncbi:MAG: DUF1343 domain-containing protein [Candidatus Fibromonas sp.]|jgi:uncharacterized protein YbbC (DUF1343 family)|nr:DUF1343 domain-containing protein [Candidatus Fibromonas sp.]